MKRLIPALSIIFIFAAFVVYSTLSSQSVGAEETPVHTVAALHKQFGMEIRSSVQQPRIDKQKAILLANQHSGLNEVASSVHAQYQLMTFSGVQSAALTENARNENPKLSQSGIQNTPVWIISYKGLNIERANNVVLTESNLVFDAETGKYLFGFKYR